jgi:rubrerythrin
MPPRFGERIPLIRREHVSDFYDRKPDWLRASRAWIRFAPRRRRWSRAPIVFTWPRRSATDARRASCSATALAEQGHEKSPPCSASATPEDVKAEEDASAHRQFVLTYVQPGLAGLMDGSVSTLAPIFAAAFATGDTWQTFLVGLSASVGAGISMGFTEAAHDDGKLSGRGSPIKRGLASGLMTALGGLGHALPYLIPHFWTATLTAAVVVFIELWAIAFIQNKYMETPFLRAAMQVVLGGSLVLAAGILIGNG